MVVFTSEPVMSDDVMPIISCLPEPSLGDGQGIARIPLCPIQDQMGMAFEPLMDTNGHRYTLDYTLPLQFWPFEFQSLDKSVSRRIHFV